MNFCLLRKLKEPDVTWQILSAHVEEINALSTTVKVKKMEKVTVPVKVKKRVKKTTGRDVNKVRTFMHKLLAHVLKCLRIFKVHPH